MVKKQRGGYKKKKNQAPSVLDFQELESNILSALSDAQGRVLSIKQLFKSLEIANRNQKLEVASFVKYLIGRGIILEDAVSGKLRAAPKRGNRVEEDVLMPINVVEGIVEQVNPRVAYLRQDDTEKEDIRIYATNLNAAFDGDRVAVKVLGQDKEGREQGRVMKVLERKRTTFVGTIQLTNNFAFVVADDRRVFNDFFIPQKEIKGVSGGEKVLVELVSWKPKDKNPIGKVVKVLGRPGENETEIHAIIAEYGLPYEFPEHIEAEANKLPSGISKEELSKRRDFRGVTTFTIDPLTAKDFDDALSIQQLDNGNYEVGIHIADVSHYVKPGSELDLEAQKRATSVYLVDRTVPMLPEKLSNDLCSLRPHEDRYTFSAVFELGVRGSVKSEWFGRGIIHSDRRFTYEEAQERIESGEGEYVEEIITLNKMAKAMQQRRMAAGAISFESIEFSFKLVDDGTPLGVFPRERKDAHKLVEEFMLLANKKVAEFVFKKKEKAKPKTMVYRVHDNPSPDKLSVFAQFVKRFGFNFDVDDAQQNVAKALNGLNKEIEHHDSKSIIETQAIRTMAKAIYTTEPKGHFGLAFKHYTHFTSPIRRYPDVMAHRLLQHYLDGGKSEDANELEALCIVSSKMEKRAADAERASVKFKQVEFMKKHENEIMEGMVSGVTEWGIFTEILETKCEGMVRISDMTDDRYVYDADKMEVVGMKYKNVYRIGDKVQVIIKKADIQKRFIDLEII